MDNELPFKDISGFKGTQNSDRRRPWWNNKLKSQWNDARQAEKELRKCSRTNLKIRQLRLTFQMKR